MNGQPIISDQALGLLCRAQAEANRFSSRATVDAYILMSLRSRPASLAGYILDDLGIDIDELRNTIEMMCMQSANVVTASKTIESVIEQAQLDARRFNCPVVDTEHILLSALQSAGPMLQSAFERFGVSIEAAIVRAEAIINDVAMGRILPEK